MEGFYFYECINLWSLVCFPAMRNKDIFHFKQFSIRHQNVTMKVGTDAVLLGAWVSVEGAREILDIGTGSGVIALMLAQRTSKAHIDAVEISSQDTAQAIENVNSSPWKDKITIYHKAVQQFTPDKQYDLIVSNPPFFINSQEPPDEDRRNTRHTTTLTHEDLLTASLRLLNPLGKLSVILPYVEGMQFISKAGQAGLYCTHQLFFKSKQDKPVERLLLTLSHTGETLKVDELILYDAEGTWSAAYKALTKDFYLYI